MKQVFVILAGIALGACSCSLFGSGQDSAKKNKAVTVLDPADPGEKTSPEVIPASQSTPDSLLIKPSLRAEKGRYSIALLLPFSLDQLSLDQLREQNPSKRNRPLVSLGIYEGVLMAIDSLRTRGAGLDLYVYDTHNSADEIRRITAKPEFSQIDLIIGPLFELEIQEAASYARQQGIPIVSPLRKPTGHQRYPSFYAINPGEEELMRLLGASMEVSERRSNIILVHQNQGEESALCEAFKKGFSDSFRLAQVRELVTTYRLTGLDAQLSGVQPNVLIIPSRDEVFVNALSRRLAGLKSQYDIRVYGLEEWRKFESITPDYFNRIKLHYLTHYWSGIRPEFRQRFEDVYRERYHALASEYVYCGYDLMLYFGRMLQVYGLNWPESAKMPGRFPGMNDAFRFRPVSGEAAGTDHQSNELLHVVRYQNDEFVVAP